jgi:exo-1,4-beta-D-glucosaminidase
VRVRDLDGGVRYDKQFKGIDLAGNRTQPLTTLPQTQGLSGTYFVELDLESGDGKPVSRNVYWLSTQQDQLDWKKSNWYLTPVTRYADFTALQSLPASTVEARATTKREGDDNVTTVTLWVPASAKSVAMFQHVSVRKSAHGDVVVPIRWSDNDVTLWPGESMTLTARYAAQGSAVLEVEGWNTAVQNVALDGSTKGAGH